MSYLVAWYETYRQYGGSEEGGWYYDSGELIRVFRAFQSEEHAFNVARRANQLMQNLQRNNRSVGSILYSGGRYVACVYQHKAPTCYPESRPHYS